MAKFTANNTTARFGSQQSFTVSAESVVIPAVTEETQVSAAV